MVNARTLQQAANQCKLSVMEHNPYNLPVVKQQADKLKEALDSLSARITAKHDEEIARLRKAVGPVPDFKGTLGKL